MRKLIKIPLFRFSMDEKLREVYKYYLKVREDKIFQNPINDYPRTINKISYSLYSAIIREYEENIKPITNDSEIQS